MFSFILLNRLNKYIEAKNLISPNQIGFMKECRTSDHVFLLQTIIEKVVKKSNQKLFAVFIDFKKAYDTVNRKILFKRLNDIGIDGFMFKNIREMYKRTEYLIKYESGHLDAISSNMGLKQGCPLSPMLFNLYIDDIAKIFDEHCEPITLQEQKISHFLYADDLVIISRSGEGLQNAIDKLYDFAERKQLSIHIKKSKSMIFNKTGKLIGRKFNIRGKELEPVKSFCYLGYDINASGTVNAAINTLYDKASKAMRPILQAISRFNLPIKTSRKLLILT